MFAQNIDLNLRWSSEIRVSLKGVDGVWVFASAVRGKTDNGGHIISVIPMEIKKGGHLFSTLTKKTNWQTNSSQSLSGQGQEGKKWASGFLYPFLLRCLSFLFPQIEKLCFEKKWKHFLDGFIVVNLASKRRLKEEMIKGSFFMAQISKIKRAIV